MSFQEQTLRNYITQNHNIPSQAVQNIMGAENIHLHGNNPQLFYNQNQTSQNNDDSLEDFKNQVKIWMRLDNEVKEFTKQIKMLNVEIKQRKKYMLSLTPFILTYMNTNEIEELNSKDGRLQYKTSLVKPPLSQKDIRCRLYETFPDSTNDLDQIFKERQKIQKVSLRRLM